MEIWNDKNFQVAGVDYLYKYYNYTRILNLAGFVRTSVRQLHVMGKTFVIYI